jgi:hypothetical protein
VIIETFENYSRKLLVDCTLDRSDVRLFVGTEERECLTGHLGAAGTANTVDVVL